MIYNSKFKYDIDFINRFKGFEWKFETDKDNSETKIYFRPFEDNRKQGAWFFNADESKPEDEHDEYTWDQEQPWLEYDAKNVEQWNSYHPDNLTRYLSAFTSFGTAISTISNVYIDTNPPKLKEWNKNSFTSINTNIKTVSLTIEEDSGIDMGCLTIRQADGTILYKSSRKVPSVSTEFIKAAPKLVSNRDLTNWTISFEIENLPAELLNENQLVLEVYDIAGNYVEIVCDNEWQDLTLDELSTLDPLRIEFYDKQPKNMIVEAGDTGSVWVDIYNPNKKFRIFDIFFELDESSVGTIDPATIDDSTYEEDGHVKFQVVGIDECGIVKVNAWLSTELNEEYDAFLKESTYAEAECGPWIVEDDEGRKYHFIPQTPKVVQNADFGEFVNYTELYLNTVYCGLDKNKRISALEKIARINNFNDINAIEEKYLYKYGNEKGNEIDLSIEEVNNFNIVSNDANETENYSIDLSKPMNLMINQKAASHDDAEYDDAIITYRNVLAALPFYNKLKGTRKGMQMMLRMFGLTCVLVNLWKNTTNNEYVSEDDLVFDNELANYFLTSRFNVNVTKINSDVKTFNDNIDTLAKLLISIKPINRILNKIVYLQEMKSNLFLNHFSVVSQTQSEQEQNIKIVYESNIDINKYSNTFNIESIYLPFSCSYMTFDESTTYDNAFAVLMNIFRHWDEYETKKISDKDMKNHTIDAVTKSENGIYLNFASSSIPESSIQTKKTVKINIKNKEIEFAIV